jgi:hypothetical protein
LEQVPPASPPHWNSFATRTSPHRARSLQEIGGISRTIRYKGNRMDIGGHRFFSKSDRVMQWWMDLMPPDASAARSPPPIQLPGQAAAPSPSPRISPKSRPCAASARCWATRPNPPNISIEDDEDPTDVAETVVAPRPADPDLVMLIRPRKSRIYYLRKFFDYPITLTGNTIKTSARPA